MENIFETMGEMLNPKSEQNNKLLYKFLNEHREPSKWMLGGASGRLITTPTGYYGDGFIADFDTLANAQYAALAVNNLHHLAEALENLINKMKSSMLTADIEYYRKEKNEAKEALNRIS